MTRRYLALIGAGKWGKNLARIFSDHGILHTICDLDDELLNKYRALYPEVKVTNDFSSVIQNPYIRQVAIATPMTSHYQLSKQALLAGKDVLVEKPLCMNDIQADELVHIAAKLQKVLMVGHVLQYHPAVLRLQEIIRMGELGAVQSVVSRRINSVSSYQEGDVLWDLAPHDISLILSILPDVSDQTVVSGDVKWSQNGIKDHISLKLQFNAEIQADVCVSRVQSVKEQNISLHCEKGTVIFDDTQPWEKKLSVYRNNQSTHVSLEMREPLREECLHFLDCCAQRQTPKTDGEEGRRVVQMLILAEKALHKNHAFCQMMT